MLTLCLLACRSVPFAGSELLRTLQPVLWAVFLGGHALHPFSNIFTGAQYTSAQSINCYQLCSAFWTQIPRLLKENNRRTLRSNSSAVQLDVARTIHKTGERAFAVCASSRWNSLPAELRQCDSLASFKRQLKMHFFNVFFNVNDVSDDTGCWTHEHGRF